MIMDEIGMEAGAYAGCALRRSGFGATVLVHVQGGDCLMEARKNITEVLRLALSQL